MNRRNRELVIFSMSALDLFASALGAFILVTIVLLPYYLKHDDVVRDNNRMRSQIAELQSAVASAQAEIAKAKQEEEKLKAEIQKLKQQGKDASALAAKLKQAQQRAQAAEQKAAAASQAASQAKEALKKANREVERRVKFALLGLSTNAQTFVIVMDMSGSMRRFETITLDTMRRILDPLTEKEQIGILGFKAPGTRLFHTVQISHWPSPGATTKMSIPNKNIAISFVQSMLRQVDGGTPTMAGLLEALKYNVDAIILLSDGAPTVPDGNWRSVINIITQRNAGRKEIHTVALGPYYQDPTFVTFLSQLARQNRGKFTGVAAR
jgi:uncharacterized protein YigA (DUF484 family)